MPKLEVRLSAEEKELLRGQAETAGTTVSEYVRTRLFNWLPLPPPPPLVHKHPPPANWHSPPAQVERVTPEERQRLADEIRGAKRPK